MTDFTTDSFVEEFNKSGMTQKQLSEVSGISQKQISQYMHGVMPSNANQKKLIDALSDIQANNNNEKKNEILIKSAKKLGMSVESLKICLIKDLFKPQIGVAIPVPEKGRFRYTIFENRLNKYLAGDI